VGDPRRRHGPGPADGRRARRTTESCLRVADELGAKSLALPAFGTGVGGFPLDECARIMVDATRAYEPSSIERVVFAVFGAEAKEAFDAALAQ
jgi:O-acetyl-ADP-ribose deacetylase